MSADGSDTDVVLALIEREGFVRALREAGSDRAAAVAAYRVYERALAARGEEPDDEVLALYREILWRDPAPARAVDELPRFATPFFGRRRERAALVELLVPGAVVVVHGPAGVGKSRLAVAAADAARAGFPDGIRYVEIGEANDAHERLARALGDGDDLRALLVVDNADHAVDGVRAALGALRRAHPQLGAIVTSRVRLRIPDEHHVPLDALALPLAGAALQVVARTPSVAFFVERAVLARVDLQFDERTAGLLSALCAAVDGLPLALELAAAQLRFYALDELLERVRGSGLDGTSLDRTLRTSVELLDRDERRAFRRLAAFTAPWTIAEAEAALTDALLPPHAILPALSGLLERSLLQSETREGVLRYRLLETTRQAALADGTEAERDAVRARAAAWCLDWMTQGGTDGTPDAQTVRALDERAELVRAVLDAWCDDDEAALRAIAAARKYWQWRGRAAESLARIDLRRRQAGALDDALAYDVARTIATHALQLGDNERAGKAIAEARAIAQRTSDDKQAVEAEHNAAILAYNRGALDEAAATFVRVAETYRRLGAPVDAARVVLNLATIALSRCAWNDAEEHLRSIAHVALPPNERVLVAKTRAYAAAMRGECVAAREFAEEAARLCADAAVADEWRVEVETVRGIVALRGGAPYDAIVHFQQALLIAPQIPFRVAAYPLEQAALAAAAIGRDADAARLLAAVDALRVRQALPRSPAFEEIFAAARAALETRLGPVYPEHLAVGAGFDAARAAELVFALPSAAPAAASPSPALRALSEREREVALLIADGCPNRAIADTLFVSVKTVENHVASIFNKLGVARRAQVAAVVSSEREAAKRT